MQCLGDITFGAARGDLGANAAAVAEPPHAQEPPQPIGSAGEFVGGRRPGALALQTERRPRVQTPSSSVVAAEPGGSPANAQDVTLSSTFLRLLFLGGVLLAGVAEANGPVIGWVIGIVPTPVTAIAVGGRQDCAIEDGTDAVVCWSDDSAGKASQPTSVDGTEGTASAIAAGESHSCAIQSGTGAVICWGGELVWDWVYELHSSVLSGEAGTVHPLHQNRRGIKRLVLCM